MSGITDVAGVLVGHHHRLGGGWATGTTVVLTPEGATGGVDGRGGAPGTRETDLLDPANLVERVHGVCLTGGSAYGLAAADGVMAWLEERGHGFPVGPGQVVPIVPAAVIFDLPAGDWGNRPDAGFGRAACENAAGGAVAQGRVGAGTGARAGGLQGGVGTASVVTATGHTVGALVVVNAAGDVADPATGVPWAADHEVDGEFEAARTAVPVEGPPPRLNTTIGVIATDAVLSKAQCRRLAMSGHDGLARAIRPAHTMVDGDTLFALATGRHTAAPDVPAGLDALCAAAAHCVARAVVHGVLAASAVPGSATPGARHPDLA